MPEDTKDSLVDKGYDPEYGARPLRRTIQNLIEDPLAEGLLQGKFRPGDIVEAVVRELGLDEAIVNVNGSGIALGHPIGATGTILTATIATRPRCASSCRPGMSPTRSS